MAKISEALKRLQEEQKKERENIYQLHQKNLESLNKNLTELYENKLNTTLNDTLERIDYELEHLRTQTKWTWLTGGIMLGIIIQAVATTIFK